MKELMTLEEGLGRSRMQIRDMYKGYVNPGLAGLLALLDFDKSFVRAEGACVWDDRGNEYLDFLAGYGALNLGHNPPAVLEALAKVKGAPVLLQASLSRLAAVLAYNLAQITPGDLKQSFFCNSGAEAVEGALKLARAATGRTRMVYTVGGFHGKTFGALSVSGRQKYRRHFEPLLPETREVPYGDSQALAEALQDSQAACFILEPVQGEGGVVVPPAGYLREVREICSRYGTLLIFDEIQTGFGRCGAMFAADLEGVVPDIMCLSKFLGGGVIPVGAFITTEKIWNKAFGGIEKCLLHTSTYGGNSWGMAAGIAAVTEAVRQDLPGQAREKGEFLMGKLREIAAGNKLIKEVRGRGLLIGIEFNPLSGGVMDKLSGGALNRLGKEYLASLVAGELLNRHRIITAYTLNNPNVIRIEPPIIVTYEQLERFLNALRETLQKGAGGFLLGSGKTMISSLLRRN